MSMLRSPLGMFAIGGLTVLAVGFLNPFGLKQRLGFAADEFTYADFEQIQIERSGVTADVIPDSLSESFMGYKFLDLQSTNMVVNTDPFGPGISDVQPRYINPYDNGFTLSDEVVTEYQAEQTSRVFDALAPGQGKSYLEYAVSTDPFKQRKNNFPRSLDNATTATTGIDYSGRDVPPRVPPEVNNNYPYLVSMIPPEAVPFQEMSTPFLGDNRFGDLSRNSEDSNVNGREGRLSLTPDVDSGYLDTSTGMTKNLSVWRNTHNIIRVSDTEVKAVPMSGGFETTLRRV
ncbi:MAG: hypothetical protein GY751_20375 [Bacteroidetes bacterium]|nr:hypothetical protein [Bacteroidota bacterium]